MTRPSDEWKVSVPEGSRSPWRVERFTVSDEDAQREAMMASIRPQFGYRGVPAGTYTRLMCGDIVVMSDTPDEARGHWDARKFAKGNVLINGLGLGMILRMVAQKPEVSHVTVVEKSPDVIALVADHYLKMFPGKITVVNADAYEYKPPKGVRYGAVWHDIWDYICGDNLAGMGKLHRKYGCRADWQGSWQKEACRHAVRRFRGSAW